jgi:cysteine desulfurase
VSISPRPRTARIYLDHNATTPLCAEARAAMLEALDAGGNPSSIHGEGRSARARVERARQAVAALLGGMSDEIVFTSGGTEADCLALVGLARLGRRQGRPAVVVTSAIEHPAVRGAAAGLAAEGFAIVDAAVDGHGRLDLDALGRAAAGAAVVAVALANHELGTLQDIASIAAVAHSAGALVACDAVQAAGKRPIDVTRLGVDALAISAHKLHGPAGVGALWLRRGLDVSPLWPAGHQERGRRAGTENAAGIAGLGAAAAVAHDRLAADAPRIAALAARLEAGLAAIPDVRIHGAGAERIGNTVNAGFGGALGESLVAALDLAGVAASTGAACTSGSVQPSAVLLGIGLRRDQAVEAVRFSLGRDTTEAEIDSVLALLPAIVDRARRFR